MSTKPQFQINLKGVTNLIIPVYRKYIFNKSRYLNLYGSAGSGKSKFIPQLVLLRAIKWSLNKKHTYKVYCIRKTGESLRNSCFQEFKDLIKAWNLSDCFNIREQIMEIDSKPETGINIQIRFKGMQDEDNIKSISSPNLIWIEESDKLTLDDFEQLDLRVRSEKHTGYPDQLICTFNPVRNTSWLKTKFFDNPPQNASYVNLKTTYKDNPFLPQSYLDQMEDMKITNPEKYRVYGLGFWGEINKENSYVKTFEESKHVKDNIKYNPNLPLHLSFDFNRVPYNSCIVFQCYEDDDEYKHITIIDEILLPDSITGDVAKTVKEKYFNHTGGMFIYGDASGTNRNTLTYDNNFTIIMKELESFHPRLKLLKKNPPLVARANFLNSLLAFEDKHQVYFKISSKCEKTVEDFLYTKENSDGAKLKQRIKDKKTGISFEPYGHILDCCEAFLTVYLDKSFSKFNRRGSGKPYIPTTLRSSVNGYGIQRKRAGRL